MERLLQHTMIRRVRLLEFLVQSNQWIATNQLTKKLNCSQQTILSDCEYFENEWPEYVVIETSKKLGIRLYMNRQHSIGELYKKMMKSSGDLSLLESLLFFPNQDTLFHKQRLYTSESSLYRSYRRLKQVLNDRNLDILHQQDTYSLVGENELQVRFFLVLYFCETYEEKEWPFPVDKQLVQDCLAILVKYFPFKQTINAMKFLAYSFAILLIREEQGFGLTNKNNVVATKVSEVDERVLTELLQPSYSAVQTIDVYRSIFWWEFGWVDPKERKKVEQLAEHYLASLCSALHVTLAESNKKELIHWLQLIYVRHKLYPYQESIIHSRFTQPSTALKRNYPLFANQVSDLLYVLEAESSFPWQSHYYNEILCETFFHWNTLYKKLDKQLVTLNILIMSDLGKEHAAFLSYLIENRFPKRVSTYYESCNSSEALSFSKVDYDLCISNYLVERVDSNELIVVEDIPSPKNWLDIAYCINQKIQQKTTDSVIS